MYKRQLQDIELSAREMRIGDNRLCLHTLSDAEDLPGKVATDTRYEKLSTDRSDCRLSFASPVGLLLSCNHIYNQYVLIDNSEETLQKFEKSARNMQSLSRYSRLSLIHIFGKSRFRMASTRTTAAIPTQQAATSEKGIELSEEEATFDDGNAETASRLSLIHISVSFMRSLPSSSVKSVMTGIFL